jgi:hypothetical protein
MLSACAPAVESGVPQNFPFRDGQRWFVMSRDERKEASFQNEIRIKGQPQKMANGSWVLYFDDRQSFFLLHENTAFLLVRYEVDGLNYASDKATLCRFSNQINPISDGLWAGSGFFGTTNGVIEQANSTPSSQQIGFCTMLRR